MSEQAAPFPWPAGSATGVGSMPGTDPAQALAVILGELPELPHLPELPARGAGADLTGRAAALLVDIPVETTAAGWKLAARPGRDQRRAAGLLAADLDAAHEAAADWVGPFKVQVAGPWTLAATVELPRSQNPALADPGAVADLTASLAEGVAAHVAEIRARIPGATVLLQLDEPALPAVLGGAVPTASGLNRVAAAEATDVSDALRAVLSAARAERRSPGVLSAARAERRSPGVLSATAAFGLVHCCARGVPFRIIKDAGARAVGFDLSQLRREDEEEGLPEAVEAGLGILAGVFQIPERIAVPPPGSPRDLASGLLDVWHRMGIPAGTVARQVVLTPACGLAAASPAGARSALARCREAARLLPELIEEGSS